MKLLILSDSHRNLDYMQKAVELERPDRIIHLGDHETDAMRLREKYPDIPMYSVTGNCDYGGAPLVINESIDGVRFYMTHGHTVGVRYGLLRAELTAREAGANVFLFGHTHESLCEWVNGIWMVNPGSCSGRGPVTYAVIELNDGAVRPKILTF